MGIGRFYSPLTEKMQNTAASGSAALFNRPAKGGSQALAANEATAVFDLLRVRDTTSKTWSRLLVAHYLFKQSLGICQREPFHRQFPLLGLHRDLPVTISLKEAVERGRRPREPTCR